MKETAAQTYFQRLDEFPHAALFENVGRVWEAVGLLGEFVQRLVNEADARLAEADALRVEGGLVMSEGPFIAEKRLKIVSVGLLVEAGARIEPGVVIKGPTVLCEGAEVRHGAYLRGGCLIGPNAVVGHATEAKNSAFLNGAQAGHFAYVGDSILGAEANLGAGVKLANLRFRTEEEKRTRRTKNIVLRVDGETLDTDLGKLGAVVGDDAEIGCNAVTSPGTLLGPGCWVAPNASVPKGVYRAQEFICGDRPSVGPRRV